MKSIGLPFVRIRMRNDYAQTPVFDKNKGKDRKKETKQSITKYNSLYICTYPIHPHKLRLEKGMFALESKMTYVTLVEWGT